MGVVEFRKQSSQSRSERMVNDLALYFAERGAADVAAEVDAGQGWLFWQDAIHALTELVDQTGDIDEVMRQVARLIVDDGD